VPLKAAALQFPLGHPQVATIIPGARSVTEIDQNVETFTTPIPEALWDELKHEQLLREDAPTP
jgi:D-threo-aldose 1-dehydrogenase